MQVPSTLSSSSTPGSAGAAVPAARWHRGTDRIESHPAQSAQCRRPPGHATRRPPRWLWPQAARRRRPCPTSRPPGPSWSRGRALQWDVGEWGDEGEDEQRAWGNERPTTWTARAGGRRPLVRLWRIAGRRGALDRCAVAGQGPGRRQTGSIERGDETPSNGLSPSPVRGKPIVDVLMAAMATGSGEGQGGGGDGRMVGRTVEGRAAIQRHHQGAATADPGPAGPLCSFQTGSSCCPCNACMLQSERSPARPCMWIVHSR